MLGAHAGPGERSAGRVTQGDLFCPVEVWSLGVSVALGMKLLLQLRNVFSLKKRSRSNQIKKNKKNAFTPAGAAWVRATSAGESEEGQEDWEMSDWRSPREDLLTSMWRYGRMGETTC